MVETMTEENHDEQVLDKIGHVLDVDGGLGHVHPNDGSPNMPAIFLTLSGVDGDGNEFTHHFSMNAFMAQRVGVYASQGSLALTELMAQQIVAGKLQQQHDEADRKENRGYL
jgi:hypothetical protein